MIKVRLYSEQEYFDTHTIPANGEKKEEYLYVNDGWDSAFWHVMCPNIVSEEERGKAPFRDDESIKFLKDTYGIVFANDEDWYSVICEGTKMNIACLNKAMLCGLGAIYNSKRGRYSWLTDMYDKEWKALGDLQMEVLIAVPEASLRGQHSFFSESDFTVVNYPLHGDRVEAKVVSGALLRDEFYTKVAHSHLYVGKDGAYYLSWFDFEHGFEYHWEDDIEGLIRHMECSYHRLPELEEIAHVYDISEFEQALDQKLGWDNTIFIPTRHHLSADDEEGRHFKDIFRITNHMRYIPKIYSRRPVMLVVDKSCDGTYKIHRDITVKWPEFDELVGEAIEHRIPDGETMILVIDVDEVIRSRKDIDSAVCGFKALRDSVEIFDRETAIHMCCEAMKEAYYSGKCEVE